MAAPFERLKEMLIRHEDLRLRPYLDSVGKLTIGVGRNLDSVGISKVEAMVLLNNDIRRVYDEAKANLPWFSKLNEPRQDVILSMIFNLGLHGFSKFKNTIQAIEKEDFVTASNEMLNSKWAKQVGRRAKELSALMLRGTY